MRLAVAAILLFAVAALVSADAPTTKPAAGPLDFAVTDINGKDVNLSQYKGQVVLIVNTASKCGLTPQYDALQKLNEKYAPQGLTILGFPCNDFKGQEPGSEAQIAEFCKTKYNVSFPMFSKVKAKGDEKTPLYAYLTSKDAGHAFGGEITWNFTKFLVGRDGQLVSRFEPKVKPDDEKVVKAIETELARK